MCELPTNFGCWGSYSGWWLVLMENHPKNFFFEILSTLSEMGAILNFWPSGDFPILTNVHCGYSTAYHTRTILKLLLLMSQNATSVVFDANELSGGAYGTCGVSNGERTNGIRGVS